MERGKNCKNLKLKSRLLVSAIHLCKHPLIQLVAFLNKMAAFCKNSFGRHIAYGVTDGIYVNENMVRGAAVRIAYSVIVECHSSI